MSKFSKDPGYQAFRILQVAFVIAPMVAGLDKFFQLLTHWTQYLSPLVMQIIQHKDHEFMMIVGVIEIVAGIGVLFKPKLFSYIVALWLFGIIINLVLAGHYLDIALRDIGLFLAAIALGKLSKKYG